MTDEIVNRPMTVEEQFESALQCITALEEAQVKQAMDLVKALAGLSGELRTKAERVVAGRTASDAEYYDGRSDSYWEVASMVDALSTGPVMQAALDLIDSQTADSGDNS